MRLLFFGTPRFAVPPLNALIHSEHQLLAVVTQPDRRSGRGRQTVMSSVKQEAQKSGLKVFQPERVGDPGFLKEVNELNPEAVVVVAYGQMLPPEILHFPEFGCINIHASLLPEYRGAAPINWAIIKGEKKTGVTTMLMDEGMDTGPVLQQNKLAIRDEDTASTLAERLSIMGAETLLETLKMLEQDILRPVPQSGEASNAPLLKKRDGLINWLLPAEELCNLIRGVNPWPGAYSFLEGQRIKILKALSVAGSSEAGSISAIKKDELLAGTGKGLLSLLEVQAAGKPVTGIKSFLQGRKLKEGMKFSEEKSD